MATINNLREFFEDRGYDMEENSMWYYGRAVYKYGIGAWVSYVIEDAPARDVEYHIVVSHDEHNKIVVKGGLLGVPADVARFFCLDDRKDSYDFDEYYKLLEAFDQSKGDMKFAFEYGGLDSIIITGKHKMPAVTREVYYEDDEANTDTLKLADKVIAVRSGSIIEGADYDATPFTMSFPFTSEEWDNAVTNLESEVSEEWEKNNTTYFKITRVSDDSEFYYGGWTQFEDAPKGTWDDDEELAAIAANAGLALFDGNEGVVPGYPDWTVTEETVDW